MAPNIQNYHNLYKKNAVITCGTHQLITNTTQCYWRYWPFGTCWDWRDFLPIPTEWGVWRNSLVFHLLIIQLLHPWCSSSTTRISSHLVIGMWLMTHESWGRDFLPQIWLSEGWKRMGYGFLRDGKNVWLTERSIPVNMWIFGNEFVGNGSERCGNMCGSLWRGNVAHI